MTDHIEREAFEGKFPVPNGVRWNPDFCGQGRYEPDNPLLNPDAGEDAWLQHQRWIGWQAARAQGKASGTGAVPEGYALVPKHADKAMIKIGKRAHKEEFLFHQDPDLNIQQIWKAMIAAAPTAPLEGGTCEDCGYEWGRFASCKCRKHLATHPRNGKQGEWVIGWADPDDLMYLSMGFPITVRPEETADATVPVRANPPTDQEGE